MFNSYRNSQKDATVYQNLLRHVYMKLNVFRATHRPSSGAQNCTGSLWFCIREVVGLLVAGRCQRPATQCPTTSRMQNQWLPVHFWAPDDGRRVARNTYKHGVINFDTLLHLVGYFSTNYAMMHGSTNIKIPMFLTVILTNLDMHTLTCYRNRLLKRGNVTADLLCN